MQEVNTNYLNNNLLDPKELSDIEKKIKIEISKSHHRMINLGGVTNAISGLLVIWILYGKTSLTLLFGWYAALILASLMDSIWAFKYEKKINDPAQLKEWRIGFYVIFAILCLVWGSLGVIFISSDTNYQLYLIAFLLAVLIGFTFSSITDFTLAIIGICSLLIPTIAFRTYLGIQSFIAKGFDPQLNFGISITLFVMGVFLLITCFIGSRLVKKFFMLSFANVALSEKLEGMNKFLEQRVQERTEELEKSLKLVTYQATHDLLTNLPNQRLLMEYMQEAINKAEQKNTMFAVICFSINELEKINDGLGHSAGDFVIKTVGQRLQQSFGKIAGEYLDKEDMMSYTITLMRKDIFVILLEPIDNLEEIEEKINKLFSVLNDPIYTENQVVKLTASIGVSFYPRNGTNIQSLLMNADAAMLRAKQRGGNSVNMYKTEINANISKQLEIERNLHTAVKNNEFIVQFQPFIELKEGQICGAEVLVRWDNPVLGFISPGEFIPLAEANGIIVPLGEWVLRTACRQTKIWHDDGFDQIKIAVNLSAKQLQEKNILETISNILKESNLNPQFIELELTETAAFQNDVIPILKKIKEMGLGLSIDDFGTGYSGLTNLKLLSIDKIKIDKSFVQDVVTNNDSKIIITNTIALAKKLNIKVVAEGVETRDQLKFLYENGCDMIQGYYFSPPINTDVFTELLKSKVKFNFLTSVFE